MNRKIFEVLVWFLFSCCGINSAVSVELKQPKEFFRPAEMLAAELSPDGSKIAAIKIDGDTQQLVLIESFSKREQVLLKLSDFTQKKSSLRRVVWLDNNNIGAQYSEIKKGVGRLVDTKKASFLLIVQVPKDANQQANVLSVRTSGWLVDALREQTDVFLYAKSSAYSKVYKLKVSKLGKHNQKRNKLQKVDGGQFRKSNEIASVTGFAAHWFFSDSESPVAVLKYNLKGDLILSRVSYNTKLSAKDKKEEDVYVLKKWTRDILDRDKKDKENEKMIMPIFLSDEKDTYYGLDFFEDEQRSVYKINYLNNTSELVYEAGSYKIIDLILSQDNKLIGVKILKNGAVQSEYLDHDVSLQKANSKSQPKSTIKSLISVSNDSLVKLYYTENHSQPGEFLLETKGKKRVIGAVFPHLSKKLDSVLIEASLKLDNLDIPYLLSMPKSTQRKPSPLIVMPHGGPIGVFDNRYFDLTTQFFVANGFSVLRVNFRGSSGQTLELKKAGKKQWGEKMLNDIYQATVEVSARTDIDANKICLFGMSYGGYAAAMLTILHPDTYRCAVDVAGVSDINLYLNSTRHNKVQDKWGIEYIGDPVAEYEELKNKSPLYQVENLTRPILIMHGDEDDRVDVEHSYRLKRMLEKHNKSFQWQIFPGEKHGNFEIETRVQLYSKAIKFLKENLNHEK